MKDPNHKYKFEWASDGWFCPECGTDATDEENKTLSAPYTTPLEDLLNNVLKRRQAELKRTGKITR